MGDKARNSAAVVLVPPATTNKTVLLDNIEKLHLFDASSTAWVRANKMNDDTSKWFKTFFSDDYCAAPMQSWSPARRARIGYDDTGFFLNTNHMRHYCGLPRSILGTSGATYPEIPPQFAQKDEVDDISAWREKVIASIFKGADRDGNGRLDMNELGLMLRRLAPKIKREDLQAIMERFDTDRSGGLDLQEFAEWLHHEADSKINEALQNSMRNEQEALRASFRLLDKDGNGTLSKEELTDILGKTCPNVTPEALSKFFASIDRDGNGEVDYHEFVDSLFS
jgi:calmodulin